MTDTAALRRAADEISAVQAEITVTTQRTDGEWRRDLVSLRRRLQMAIATMSGIVGMLGHDDPEVRALRDAFESMRSRIALHQASWPAVTIDRDDPGYGRSLREIRRASQEFLRLVDVLSQRTSARS